MAVAVVVGLTFLFVMARSTGYGPGYTDISVWVFVHEWLSRGVPMYAGVWDHKDWGFFAITEPFYRAGAITGLYVSAVAAAASLAVGVYLCAREAVSWRRAAVIASLAAATYVVAPSYYATYTENYGIAVAVLGVGLLFRYPVASGVVFALSTSVKVSSAAVVVCVVVADVAVRGYRRRHDGGEPVGTGSWWRVLVGFAGASAVILLFAGVQGALPGWLDVIRYNSEYGAMRRGGFPSPLDWSAFAARSNFDGPTMAFVITLIAVIAVLGTVLIALERRTGKALSASAQRTLIVTAAVVVGCIVVLTAQYPLAPQHWQYLVGGLMPLLGVVTAGLWSRWASIGRLLRAAVIVVVLFPLVLGCAVVLGNEGPLGLPRELNRWRTLNDGGDSMRVLEGVASGATVAFVNVGGRLVDPETIPEDISLGCRFFYQFPHLQPRYGDEMLSCLESGPDYIVIRRGSDMGDRRFTREVRRLLESRYTHCVVAEDAFELWAREAAACPAG